MVPTPSTTELLETRNSGSEPPGYFDIVPDSHVFFPPKHLTPGSNPSTAQPSERTKGIYSHDPVLNHNPSELWRFLVSNLRQPRLAVHLLGTHTETGTRSTTTVTETHTDTVTDFSFQLDVSKYVVPQWSRIIAKGGKLEVPTVRETLEEYTSSRNPLKEFRLHKVVLWDMESVTRLLTGLVRSTGYREDIAVRFPTQEYKWWL